MKAIKTYFGDMLSLDSLNKIFRNVSYRFSDCMIWSSFSIWIELWATILFLIPISGSLSIAITRLGLIAFLNFVSMMMNSQLWLSACYTVPWLYSNWYAITSVADLCKRRNNELKMRIEFVWMLKMSTDLTLTIIPCIIEFVYNLLNMIKTIDKPWNHKP